MKKTYDMLFARGSTGAVLSWYMEQDGDKYRTTSGQLDGKKVTSEPTTALPKNQDKSNSTTGEQQATVEIEARYAKQLKSGGYFLDINNIDEDQYIAPMLAKGFLDRLDKIEYPVWVDRKYNGMRCICTKRNMFSRKGEVIHSAPHILENLKSIFEKNPNLVADGELYNHDYRFHLNQIMKLVRKTVHITADDLSESKSLIKYFIYDGYNFAGITVDTPFIKRREALFKLFGGVEGVVVVDCKKANSEKEVYDIYNTYVEDGYEGAIIRLNKSYQNRRSSHLLKMKPEDSDEGVIQDILEGEGNWSGTGKIIVLKWKDKTFNATFKGTFEQAQQFLKDKNKWIGQEVQFLFNGLTGLGVPNFARMDIDNNTSLK